MSPAVILDTGPLVALLNREERHHRWAVTSLERVATPLITCEAVLSEACHLLRRFPPGVQAVMDLVHRGLLDVSFHLAGEETAVGALMRRYSDVPMSLADACLVRLSELHPDSVVATLDGDFRIYRRGGRKVIPVLMPGLAG